MNAPRPDRAANSTLFGPHVYVFDPGMPPSAVQAQADAVFREMEGNEFGAQRYALLFKPGTYPVLFDVGFYTTVAGLGHGPDDVRIVGGANVPAYWMPHRNATCNFWRSYENLSIEATEPTNRTTTIAVSQVRCFLPVSCRRLVAVPSSPRNRQRLCDVCTSPAPTACGFSRSTRRRVRVGGQAVASWPTAS